MSDLTVPTETLRQLGGARRLGAMIGATGFIGSDDSLSFRIKARARDGINALNIILDPSDTYTVEFLRCTIKGRRVVDSASQVYNDGLRQIIEARTGLHLSM